MRNVLAVLSSARPLILMTAVATAALAAACGGSNGDEGASPHDGGPAVRTNAGEGTGDGGLGDSGALGPGVGVGDAGPVKPLLASAHLTELSQVGLDPANLPALKSMNDAQLTAVMGSFTKSLGVNCSGCHDASNFAKDTPNKLVAGKMWDTFVRGLKLGDGSPVYCDSCHQGAQTYLPRSNRTALHAYMQTDFVGGLKAHDGSAIACATCHGSPFVGPFLDKWKAGN